MQAAADQDFTAFNEARAKAEKASEPIRAALLAFYDAAWERFVADGFTDVGACGGMMLAYRANSRPIKALAELGMVSMDCYVAIPHLLPTQHAEVEIAGLKALRDHLRALGFQPKKEWTYVD